MHVFFAEPKKKSVFHKKRFKRKTINSKFCAAVSSHPAAGPHETSGEQEHHVSGTFEKKEKKQQ